MVRPVHLAEPATKKATATPGAQAENLCLSYGGFQALTNVNVEIKQGILTERSSGEVKKPHSCSILPSHEDNHTPADIALARKKARNEGKKGRLPGQQKIVGLCPS